MPKRRRKKSRIKARAYCEQCRWKTNEPGAMGLGALHHDDTGHTVVVDQRLEVKYG